MVFYCLAYWRDWLPKVYSCRDFLVPDKTLPEVPSACSLALPHPVRLLLQAGPLTDPGGFGGPVCLCWLAEDQRHPLSWLTSSWVVNDR